MKALIIGSGSDITVESLEWVRGAIGCVICADGGLGKVAGLGLTPDIILGDFDSVDKEVLEKYSHGDAELLTYPVEKNYTDMELAVECAVGRGYDDIVLIGATGTRLDHTMANILLVERYFKNGIYISIVDDNNMIGPAMDGMKISGGPPKRFMSIVPLSKVVTGITLTGFKYPLTDMTVERGSTLCISNEVVDGVGIINIKSGSAVVFVSKD